VCVGVVSADLKSGRHESICGLGLCFFSLVMLEENEGVWRHTVVLNDPALLQGLEASILWCLPVALCI
jgi:hypothetical protein